VGGSLAGVTSQAKINIRPRSGGATLSDPNYGAWK